MPGEKLMNKKKSSKINRNYSDSKDRTITKKFNHIKSSISVRKRENFPMG